MSVAILVAMVERSGANLVSGTELCSPESPPAMPQANSTELDWMATQLRTGPLVIGESHSQIYAREAIVYLMVARAIGHLSIEAPIVPSNIARADGQLIPTERDRYFNGFDEVDNRHYTMRRLAGMAAARNIPVYCHDMPASTMRLRNVDQGYVAQAQHYATEGRLPSQPSGLVRIVGRRNAFSGRYLRATLGGGVATLHGLVILTGDQHTLPIHCGGRDATIQACLGIADARVHHLD